MNCTEMALLCLLRWHIECLATKTDEFSENKIECDLERIVVHVMKECGGMAGGGEGKVLWE